MSRVHAHAHMWGWWLFVGLGAVGTLWTLVAALAGPAAAAADPLRVLQLSGQSVGFGVMLGFAIGATVVFVAERAEARDRAEREEKAAQKAQAQADDGKPEKDDDADDDGDDDPAPEREHEAHEIILVPHGGDRDAYRATLIRRARTADYGKKSRALTARRAKA